MLETTFERMMTSSWSFGSFAKNCALSDMNMAETKPARGRRPAGRRASAAALAAASLTTVSGPKRVSVVEQDAIALTHMLETALGT
jgi:hypothetical protein